MRSARKFLNLFGLVVGLTTSPSFTLAQPPATLTSSDEGNDALPLLGPFLSSSFSSKVRALERSERASAPLELIALLAEAEASGNATGAYLAVRALGTTPLPSARTREALLLHLRRQPSGGSAERWNLARGTAAMALAARPDPAVQRALLLLAREADEASFPRWAAREALAAHPVEPRVARELLAPFALPGPDRAPDPSARPDTEDCNLPTALTAPTRLDGPTNVAVLRPLLNCRLGKGLAWAEELQQAMTKQPSLALRTAAVLVARGLPPSEVLLNQAHQLLREGEAGEQAAAAWFLAVAQPDQIPRLLTSNRPAVSDAARNQLLANGTTGEGSPPQDDWLPWPEAWTTQSTRQIRTALQSAEGDTRTLLLAPWSSRLTGDRIRSSALSPSSTELLTLLREGQPVDRAHVVFGLGLTAPAHHATALGLLRGAYDRETHPGVRSLVCASLRRLLGDHLRAAQPGRVLGKRLSRASTSPEADKQMLGDELSRLAGLDPVPACRALLSGSAVQARGAEVLLAFSPGEFHWAPRTALPPLLLRAAPDGFIGAVAGPTTSRASKRGARASSSEAGSEASLGSSALLFQECGNEAIGPCDWSPQSPP